MIRPPPASHETATLGPRVASPPDWPVVGSIAPAGYDSPHRRRSLERWYLNAHVTTPDGRELSLFAAFLRKDGRPGADGAEPGRAHALTWAISDPVRRRYHPSTRVEVSAPGSLLESLDRRGAWGPMDRALAEQIRHGVIPPDRAFASDVRVAARGLELVYGTDLLVRLGDGSYRLVLSDREARRGCDLRFIPRKRPVRFHDRVRSSGPVGGPPVGYCITRLDVQGTITLDGESATVRGSGWYDQGLDPFSAAVSPAYARNWTAVQLDDGSEVLVLALVDPHGHDTERTWAFVAERDGRVTHCRSASLEPLSTGWWRSTRSFHAYPTAWRLTVPTASLELDLEADFPGQELMTLISGPPSWNGRVVASGQRRGRTVTGRAWVERKGFAVLESMDELLETARDEVIAQIASVLPLRPSPHQLIELVGGRARPEYIQDLDADQYARAVIEPLRGITDRGGKAWRSFGMMACIDAVGGYSERFRRWLTLPEIIHSGSLILDDIEDGAEVRRGGRAAHRTVGEPIALNAGCAAYFLAEYPMMNVDLPPHAKLRIYGYYFEAMRAGHAGQALDLDGMAGLVPGVLEHGDARSLEQRIRALYRLKTGAPVGAIARMGAVAGGGSEAEIDALGRYFEALGLAFQILDDVLDLRGFADDRKPRGEDVRAGKVTLIAARAFSLLAAPDRAWLWDVLRSGATTETTVTEAIERLEACGAVEACVREAANIVEAAWEPCDRAIPDSFHKALLRALGWYVVERGH